MANQAAVGKPLKSYALALSTVAAATSTPITLGVRMVRLVVGAAAWVTVAPAGSPTVTSANGLQLAANVPEYFLCSGNGNEVISGILASGNSQLNITEITQ
jgi:hypothetical protein